MAGGGGAYVIVVGDECSLVEALEAGDVLCTMFVERELMIL